MEVRADKASELAHSVVMPPLFELETGPDGRVYATDPSAHAVVLPTSGEPEPTTDSISSDDHEAAPEPTAAPSDEHRESASSSMIAARRFSTDAAPPVGAHLDDRI